MKTISMDLHERQYASTVLATQQAGPLDALTISKIYEKIKLSKSEELMIGLTSTPQGMSWSMPEGTPPVEVSFEDAELVKFRDIMNSWQGYRAVTDAGWINTLLKKIALA
jgi:hypothetical protein